MTHFVLRLLALGALLAVAIQPAAGDYITDYSEEGEFTAQLQPGFYLEDFGGLTPGFDVPSPTAFSQGGYGYSASATSGALYANTVGKPAAAALSVSIMNQAIQIDFTGDPVTAVGGYFTPTNAFGTPVGGSVVITFNGGEQHTLTASGSDWAFGGFTSSVPITQITVGGTAYPAMDHFYVGAAIVPEPATLVQLTVLALVGVGLVWRRRRRTR